MDSALDIAAKGKELIKALDEKLIAKKITVIEKLHESTGVNRSIILMAGILALLSFIFFGFGANFLTNAIGFTWPAYKTFKAIESDDLKDDAFWLKYWVCFGVLTIADGALSFVLWWMPFYYLVKAGVVLYLMLDATRGAEVAYDFLVRPLLHKYQDFIDDSVVKATEAFSRAAGPEVEPELEPASDEWQTVEQVDSAVGHTAKED